MIEIQIYEHVLCVKYMNMYYVSSRPDILKALVVAKNLSYR